MLHALLHFAKSLMYSFTAVRRWDNAKQAPHFVDESHKHECDKQGGRLSGLSDSLSRQFEVFIYHKSHIAKDLACLALLVAFEMVVRVARH
jgi:hypothetical protein